MNGNGDVWSPWGWLLVTFFVACAVACDDPSELCTRDSQCPDGYACADGVCSPKIIQDSAPGVDRGQDQGLDRQPDRQLEMLVADGEAGTACTANNNGKIERQEVVFKVPSQVKVTSGSGIVVNLAGLGSAGKRQWDLTAKASDDKDEWLKVEAVPSWAAGSFKGATYASRLTANFGLFTKTDLLGVFQVKATSLQLVGGVSTLANHTKFSYAKPLDTLRFPVVLGDSYTTESDVSGHSVFTVPMWIHESYQIKVRDRGKLALLPNLSLSVLLVSVKQEAYFKANPLLKTHTYAYIFVAECYGVVARVIADGDPGNDLSKVKASQRWKLAAP